MRIAFCTYDLLKWSWHGRCITVNHLRGLSYQVKFLKEWSRVQLTDFAKKCPVFEIGGRKSDRWRTPDIILQRLRWAVTVLILALLNSFKNFADKTPKQMPEPEYTGHAGSKPTHTNKYRKLLRNLNGMLSQMIRKCLHHFIFMNKGIMAVYAPSSSAVMNGIFPDSWIEHDQDREELKASCKHVKH